MGNNQDAASILIGGQEFHATSDAPLLVGRSTVPGIVGLDPNDMGISGEAASIEFGQGVWWVVNRSTKRPLLLEAPSGPGRITLPPEQKHAITTPRISVIVAGVIFSHVLEVVLPESYASGLAVSSGGLGSGTLNLTRVDVSDREHDALAALCAGYLETFPRHRPHPNSYEDAAQLLGGVANDWNAKKVNKAVDRVKEKFDKKGEYFAGDKANYELAEHLIRNGQLTPQDLERLPGRRA